MNLCSRIEGIALPGGIACSSEMTDDQEGIYTRDYGFVKLKNIPKAHKVFRLYCDDDERRNQSNENLNRFLFDLIEVVISESCFLTVFFSNFKL